MSSKPGLHPLEVLESESQETKEEQILQVLSSAVKDDHADD